MKRNYIELVSNQCKGYWQRKDIGKKRLESSLVTVKKLTSVKINDISERAVKTMSGENQRCS